MNWIEWIGYAGSLVIALSMTMGNIKRLRILSLLGSALFVVYAGILEIWPIFAVNLFIAGVNLVHLIRIRFAHDYFTLNETLTGKEFFIGQFLAFHREDIEKVCPGFDLTRLEDPKLIVIMRNLNPVGLFVYTVENLHVVRIHLDYSAPSYRDMKNARVLLRRTVHRFRELGYLQFVAHSTVPNHQKYLRRLGFVEDAEGGVFRRAV
jgi:hypothetical protein